MTCQQSPEPSGHDQRNIQLIDLKENPDCDSEEYKKFIKGYYFGHDELNQLNQDTINEVVSKQELKDKKPWWKFW